MGNDPSQERVEARVLRSNGLEVVVALNARDAVSSTACDIAVLDSSQLGEDLDSMTRDILAAGAARGILFFDASSVSAALRSLRELARNVREALDRFELG